VYGNFNYSGKFDVLGRLNDERRSTILASHRVVDDERHRGRKASVVAS